MKRAPLPPIDVLRQLFSYSPETYISPANEAGEVQHWCELVGSFRGGLDHKRALKGAGYTVKKDKG